MSVRGGRRTRTAAALMLTLTCLAAMPARAAQETVDLAAMLPAAQVLQSIRGVPLFRFASPRHFTAGWYVVEPDPDNAKKSGFAWTHGRNSVFETTIVRPVDLRVKLTASSLQEAGDVLPRQQLRLLWNGHDLGLFAVDPEPTEIVVDVPAALQHRGANTLQLMPLYWVEPAGPAELIERRPMAVRVSGLLLESQQPEVFAGKQTAWTEDGVIVQRPGTTIGYAFELPTGARLRASGALRWKHADAIAEHEGELSVSLQTRESGERVLLRRSLGSLTDGEEIALDVDLSQHAGELARITFSFSLREWRKGLHPRLIEPVKGVELRWRDARLHRTPPSDETPQSPQTLARKVARDRYNIVVILLDTLRADHIGPYGAETRTPALDALASRGVTFDSASANATWTLPSVATLLTGLRPTAHRTASVKDKLASGAPFLPAILSDAGYRTVGISNNGHISTAMGFSRGFEHFHEFFRRRFDVLRQKPSPEQQAALVWSSFIEPVIGTTDEQPFFVYLHEIDPHAPYDAPPPYDTLYDFGYRGNLLGYDVEVLTENLRILRAANAYRGWLGAPEVRFLESRYDAEITFMDRYIGVLLERLAKAGHADDTVVLFLSDHGEEFMEHGHWGHGQSVYEELVRIPMIFSLPGVIDEGARSSEPVQLIDVAPTLLDLVGIEPSPLVQGASLLPALTGGRAIDASRAVLARSNRSNLPKGTPFRLARIEDSVRIRDWKLIRRDKNFHRKGYYDYQLYDLSTDPGEEHDLWPQQPIAGAVLRQELEWRHHLDSLVPLEAEAGGELDAELRDNLKALGYVE